MARNHCVCVCMCVCILKTFEEKISSLTMEIDEIKIHAVRMLDRSSLISATCLDPSCLVLSLSPRRMMRVLRSPC